MGRWEKDILKPRTFATTTPCSFPLHYYMHLTPTFLHIILDFVFNLSGGTSWYSCDLLGFLRLMGKWENDILKLRTLSFLCKVDFLHIVSSTSILFMNLTLSLSAHLTFNCICFFRSRSLLTHLVSSHSLCLSLFPRRTSKALAGYGSPCNQLTPLPQISCPLPTVRKDYFLEAVSW